MGVRRAVSGSEPVAPCPGLLREVDLGDAQELLATARAVCEVDGVQLLLIRVRKAVFAIENTCPHLARRLDDATLRRYRLHCHGHGRQYDLRTGAERSWQHRPGRGLRRFPVRVADGRLLVTLPTELPHA